MDSSSTTTTTTSRAQSPQTSVLLDSIPGVKAAQEWIKRRQAARAKKEGRQGSPARAPNSKTAPANLPHSNSPPLSKPSRGRHGKPVTAPPPPNEGETKKRKEGYEDAPLWDGVNSAAPRLVRAAALAALRGAWFAMSSSVSSGIGAAGAAADALGAEAFHQITAASLRTRALRTYLGTPSGSESVAMLSELAAGVAKQGVRLMGRGVRAGKVFVSSGALFEYGPSAIDMKNGSAWILSEGGALVRRMIELGSQLVWEASSFVAALALSLSLDPIAAIGNIGKLSVGVGELVTRLVALQWAAYVIAGVGSMGLVVESVGGAAELVNDLLSEAETSPEMPQRRTSGFKASIKTGDATSTLARLVDGAQAVAPWLMSGLRDAVNGALLVLETDSLSPFAWARMSWMDEIDSVIGGAGHARL